MTKKQVLLDSISSYMQDNSKKYSENVFEQCERFVIEEMGAISLIAKERQEQIEKHGRTTEQDVINNTQRQLSDGASALISIGHEGVVNSARIMDVRPLHWDKEIWFKMYTKPYRERLIIAGALIAAELDRLKLIDEI